MDIHESIFGYLNPTEEQKGKMAIVRGEFLNFVMGLNVHIPDGPDKTYLIRQLRDCAMWANVAIIRHPDGTPRT